MPLWRDDPRPSRGSLATVAFVGAVGIASMQRVFVGHRYALWAVPAAVGGATVSILIGPRSLGRGLLVLIGGWALTLPALFAHAHTFALFPTSSSIHDIRTLFAAGLTKPPPADAPPVIAEPRYLIILWTSLLFLGFLAGSWVVVRRPIGAVLTSFAAVVFSGGIGDGPGRNAYTIAAVAGVGAFFLSEGRQRIERWGRSKVPIWFGVPTLAAASAFALVAPTIFGDNPVFQLHAVMRPRLVIIKPLSDIHRQLKIDPPVEVLRVTAAKPTYWRLTALDSYDGTEWVLRARPQEVSNGSVPQARPETTGEILGQRYTLTSLLAPWLPAAYAAQTIDTKAGVDVDKGSQTLLLRGETKPGLTYSVRSRLPRIAGNVPAKTHRVTDPNEKLFGQIAAPIAGSARTPLDAARRLETYFHRFTYDEDVASGHSVQRLRRFLADRRGYCEQFAATMTLMMRGLGYDARVGVGFLPGGYVGSRYIVSTEDAHAWVEANIPNSGWVTFDPTPPRGASAGVPPQRPQLPKEVPPIPKITTLPESTPSVQQQQHIPTSHHRNIPVRALVEAMLAVIVLASVPGAKRIRRSRRKGALPPMAAVGAFAELVDRATDLGWRAIATETQREYSHRLFAAGTDDAHDASAQLVDVTLRALFGPAAPTAQDSSAAWQALPVALGSLRANAPRWRRVVAVFDPRTFIPPVRFRGLRMRLRARTT